jgi:outer membrane protein
MRIKILLFTLFCIISFQSLIAQQVWSLRECISYAHQNNLQIKRTELQADIADNNYLQSKLNIFPTVNAGFDRSYNFGRHIEAVTNEIVDYNTWGDSYGISSRVDLFSGLQNYNKMKQSNSILLASMQDVEKEKVDITMSIATAYLEILFQKELLQINQNQKETIRLQVERTEKLVEAGSVAKGNLYEIQAQFANEKLNTINAQNSLKLAKLNLVQILDLDSLSGFEIDFADTIDIQLLPLLPNATEVYQEALDFLPHIKSAEYQYKSSETNLKIQKGGISPTVYASASLGTRYSSSQEENLNQNYGEQLDINMNKYIGLGVSVPIFNKGRVKNNIDNAKIQLYDAEFLLEQTKQQLYKNIQQAHSDAVSAQEKYNAALEAVNSYKEAFHYTEQKFNVGIVNSVDYNIAKNNLIKAESDLLQAKYSYIFSVKILDLYKGIPITL